MNAKLQALCEQMAENRAVLRAALRWEDDQLYPVGANLFCAAGRTPDPERLAAARALVKAETGLFSNFRGHVRLPLICMLSMEEDPADRMRRIREAYRALKGYFYSSDYLALAAFSLSERTGNAMDAAAERSRVLYDRMKREHRFLTGSEDSVFAVLLALSDRSDDALTEDAEACYERLKLRFRDSNSMQTVSHVLALDRRSPKEKTERVADLYDELVRLGGKYSRCREMAVLAALALTDGDVRPMAAEILEASDCLRPCKGWNGIFGFPARTRAMHAAMLVTDLHMAEAFPAASVASLTGVAAAEQTVLAAVLAAQMATCAIVAASASSSSSGA